MAEIKEFSKQQQDGNRCVDCPANGNICEAGPDEACKIFWEHLNKEYIRKQ